MDVMTMSEFMKRPFVLVRLLDVRIGLRDKGCIQVPHERITRSAALCWREVGTLMKYYR